MPTEWIKQASRGITLGYEDTFISHYMYRIFFGQDNYLRMMWNYIDHILVTQMYVIYTVLLKTLYTRADLVKYLAAESVFGRVNDYITCPSFLLHHYFIDSNGTCLQPKCSMNCAERPQAVQTGAFTY